ncbi:MAG: DUF4988 domain-containing protein, partial [Clostridia bacterium]|nr:DUF4988 domain-containing protein [Clostridia bacterium]
TGADGADGQTPFIDSEGYWCIGYDYDDEGNATPHRITDASGKPYKAIGSDGKSADVWTIVGGYWYKNDEKYTDEENPDGIKAQATDGNTPYVDDEGYWCIGGERVKDGNGDYVLARGTNGNNGTDGLTPYVDDEGYWCIGYDTDEDGNETPHRLKDSAGNDIPATGTNGSNGEDGKSYVTLPCPDNDGWFNLYVVTKDTDDEGITTYSYEEYQEHFYQYATGTTLTVLVDGNYLYIYNYYTKDEDDNYVLGANPYTIYLGSELTSIAFVPDWLDSETHYPTTDPFVSITSYLSEYGVEDASNEEYAFVEQTTEASIVDPNINLVYRVNPADAYVQNVNYEFVNRNVKVRSSDVPGDGASPLSIISFTDNANGEPYITMKVGLTGDLSTDGYDFTALKVFSGSDKVITSDYIVLKALEDVKPVLVNPADVKFTTDATTKEEVIAPGYYPRTRGFNCVSVPTKFVAPDTVKTLETSKWIKEDIATVLDPNATTPGDTAVVTFDKDNTNGAWNLEFNYNSSLNITENVDLYVAIGSEDAGTLQAVRLADYVDPDSITYEYTYPDAFYIVDADGNGVNQQEYAHLIDNGDGTVKIDVAGDSADSIDKYPVVRVDAYVSGYLVASTYIVFHITAKHLDDATVDLTASWINYRAITGNYVDNYANTVETHYSYTLAQFVALFADNNSLVDIEDINDVETYYVTSTYDFEFYSVNTGSHDQQIGGKNDKLNGIVNNASATENGTDSGINYGSYGVPIHYFYDSSTTDDHTVFYFGVNNVIWTQHTYSDTYVTNVDGNGVSHNYAPYLLTITFNSKDDRFAPNLTLSWPFYVTDYCVEFEITNPYQIPDPTEYLYPCDTAVVTGH